MADENDPVIDEIEAEPIEAPNPIADFLKSVEDQDFTSAEKQFNDMVGDRLQDTIDQTKARIAASIYGDDELQSAMDEVEQEAEDEEEPENDELDDHEDQSIADEEEEKESPES